MIQTFGLDNARNAQMIDSSKRRAKRSGVDLPMTPAGMSDR